MCILYIYLFIYLSIYICIYVKVRKSVLDGIEIRMTRIEEASTCSPLSLTQLLSWLLLWFILIQYISLK